MSLTKRLTSHTNRLRKKTEKKLDEYSSPSVEFFVLIGLSAALAVAGLALDNTAVVIGAMVVAPLITPIFGFSLGLLVIRVRRITKSLLTTALGSIFAVVSATIVAKIIIALEGTGIVFTNEIVSRTEPNLLFFLVALFSGLAGAYAYAKPKLSERIAGIAIAVALVPPLAVIGIALAQELWSVAYQSMLLYLFNLAGIIFGSIIMFILVGFGKDIENSKF